MLDDRQIPEKPFYRIAEVCQYTDTQPYVIRFWESEFPQLAPRKGRSGQRVYRREDIDLILRIKHLLHAEEYTIAGARRRLEEERELLPPAVDTDAAGPSASDAAVETARDPSPASNPRLAEPDSLGSRLAASENERRRLEARGEELLSEIEALRDGDASSRWELARARLLAAEAAKEAAERALRIQRAKSLEVADLLEEALARIESLEAGLGIDDPPSS